MARLDSGRFVDKMFCDGGIPYRIYCWERMLGKDSSISERTAEVWAGHVTSWILWEKIKWMQTKSTCAQLVTVTQFYWHPGDRRLNCQPRFRRTPSKTQDSHWFQAFSVLRFLLYLDVCWALELLEDGCGGLRLEKADRLKSPVVTVLL